MQIKVPIHRHISGVNTAGSRGDTPPPQMSDGEETVMHHVPPNMAEISLHKRQRIRLYLLNYVIVLFLSNITCLQLCQMFYRGQLCELYFQILDHKQSRCSPQISHQIYATEFQARTNGRYGKIDSILYERINGNGELTETENVIFFT